MGEQRDRVLEWARRAEQGENPAVPAATVALVRDGHDGLETLMVHKDSKVAFGGMWVFPGGRVDVADRHEAADELEAARHAAAREAEEEAGLRVEAGVLEWISFWVPPAQTPRRFATWFFVAPAPAGAVIIDEGEIRDHRWLRPERALELRDAGEIELAPPTWVTLHWLSGHRTVAAAVDAAAAQDPERYETRLVVVEEGAVAMWERDAGYETRDPDVPGPRHRLWLTEAGWRYERTG